MKKPTLGDVLTVALVLVQCAFLLAVTFAAGGATLDGDAAKVCANLRGVWEQGRLILQDWVYPTTMELDCALLFALPFYGLTGDPVLALHLADGVLVFAWAGVVWLLGGGLGGVPVLCLRPPARAPRPRAAPPPPPRRVIDLFAAFFGGLFAHSCGLFAALHGVFPAPQRRRFRGKPSFPHSMGERSAEETV